MTTTLIALDEIDIGQRKRPFRADFIDELAASLEEAGQINPIVVVRTNDGRYRLVAGHHRLEAARCLG